MLIVLSGLPGVGKSTAGRQLATDLGAAYVRIDTIEAALAAGRAGPVGAAGYAVGYGVAEDQLRAGLSVVADSVNPLHETRAAWREVGDRNRAVVIEVEIICSDRDEHRRRVESRLDGSVRQPTWDDVVTRRYEPWVGERHVVDTAGRDVLSCVAQLRDLVAGAAAASRQT